MSQLLDFYRLTGRDIERRKLSDFWAFDDSRFEMCHDFIQWMFPLDEPSTVNFDAPLVAADDRHVFQNEPQLQHAMRQSFKRFLEFVGLTQIADGAVVRAENFEVRSAIWKYQNHNWLRVTRVLKSLRLLGFHSEARAFWFALNDLHKQDGFVSAHTFEYWEDAAAGL